MARMDFSEALLIVQFVVAMWQLLQLTPAALLIRVVYMFVLEYICLTSEPSERIVLNTHKCDTKKKKVGFGMAELSTPIIYASQTYDYFNTASMGWLNGTRVDRDELGFDSFQCTWLNRTLKFRRYRDEAHAHAYFITCETRDRKHRFYVPDFPNRIWSDIYNYFSVKQNITLKNKFKLVGKLEYAELCSYCEVLDNIIIKGQRVRVGGPAEFLPKPTPKQTRLLACLNLLGLYGQLHNWSLYSVAALTIISSLLQFFERSRDWIYGVVHDMIVAFIQLLVDNTLPLKWRAVVYSLKDWLPKLQPCNDVQMRVIRGGNSNSSPLYFFSYGNVECGDLVKVNMTLEEIEPVLSTYVLEVDAHDPSFACLSGGFGNDKNHISTDPLDLANIIAQHICHLGGGALAYCRGNHVQLKSLKASFHCPYHLTSLNNSTHIHLHRDAVFIWQATHKVTVR